ncbi:MAG: T9SS type A sorting domain-containing protein [Sphingobacteriaceae bacterium]|nr:T9SS type A sorting domain-containing protein [Sphingobacteriaceae bacterium]
MKINKIILIGVLIFNKIIFAQETIAIDAGTDSGVFKNYTGFLHGETNLNAKPIALDLVKKLRPNFWRNSDWYQTQKLADSLSVNTTLVVSDFYANFKGGYANAKPWLNWTEYETFVNTLVTNYIAAGLSPNYWDIWNKPNDISYWSGTLTQLVECFKRTRLVVNSINPTIKLIGPSINSYDGAGIEYILDSLASHGVTLNGVSWHEFGLPDSLTNHTNNFKSRLLLNLSWGTPEIHINEYSPQQTNQIPAYRLAWLYYLEQNNITWANTACWNNFDGITNWSNCNVGLNGLFWHDEQSPLPAYWITRAYAEMQNGKRIFCTNSDPKTLALSSKTNSLQEMRVLVGRYYSIDNGTFLPGDVGKDSSNVSITIINYPYLTIGSVPLVIQKIPKGNLIFQNSPLNSPITVFNGTTNVTGGSINITLPNFRDGDVYYAYLNSTSIIGIQENISKNDLSVFPNPASSFIHINSETLITNIQLVNVLGDVVLKEFNTDGIKTIDVSSLKAGVYFLKCDERFIEKIIIQ